MGEIMRSINYHTITLTYRMTNWAAIGIGLLILAAAISKKKVEYFRCWNCNGVITKNTTTCPHCGSHNNWSEGFA